MVSCDLWDRARAEQVSRNGVVYQKSLRDTGRFQEYLPDYQELLDALSQRYDMPYRLRFEEEFMDNPEIPGVLQDIIRNRSMLGPKLAPSTGAIAVRAACPDCGLVDKYGAKNNYAEDGTSVSFECPDHGRFSFSTLRDVQQFQFNCQTYNLVMGLFYERVPFNYIEICGSDYAGFWQEQLLLRFLSNPILIVYTPLIVDWSGLKVSKSLYLQDTAYDYLRRAGQEYLLNYRILRSTGKNISLLWDEVERWVDEPYRLFRAYSLHYLHLLFEEEEVSLGTIH